MSHRRRHKILHAFDWVLNCYICWVTHFIICFRGADVRAYKTLCSCLMWPTDLRRLSYLTECSKCFIGKYFIVKDSPYKRLCKRPCKRPYLSLYFWSLYCGFKSLFHVPFLAAVLKIETVSCLEGISYFDSRKFCFSVYIYIGYMHRWLLWKTRWKRIWKT